MRDSYSRQNEGEKAYNRAWLTPFQEAVYACVARIPAGKVATYREIARVLGCGSCRAIGQALKKNPYAPRVPCHRVIKSDLRIGGFRGSYSSSALREKENLLRQEGVLCRHGKLVDTSRIHTFSSA